MTRTTGEPISLTGLARQQYGVLLTHQATDLGWPPRLLNRRLRRGGWTQIQRGAWAEPGLEIDRMVRLRAIQLVHPELVASHRTAAWLHEIELPWEGARDGGGGEDGDGRGGGGGGGPGLRRGLRESRGEDPTLEFTIDTGTLSTLSMDRLHRMPLPTGDVGMVSRLRTTTVDRTLVDLLLSGPRDDAVVAVDSAVSIRPVRGDKTARRPALTHLPLVAAALRRGVGAGVGADVGSRAGPGAGAGTGSRRGVRTARARLILADRKSGSPAETLARLRIHDAGLHPESQVEVRPPGKGSRRRSVDFLFRAEGVAVEIEGYAYHGSRAAHQRDVRRFNELMACDLIRELLRFTALDVYQRPSEMINEIHEALSRLGRR